MAGRVSQYLLEQLAAATARVKVSQDVIEVLEARVTPSAATPTGAGVSQAIIEVLMARTGSVRVSQDVIEVLVQPTDGFANTTHGGGGGGGTTSYGWSS